MHERSSQKTEDPPGSPSPHGSHWLLLLLIAASKHMRREQGAGLSHALCANVHSQKHSSGVSLLVPYSKKGLLLGAPAGDSLPADSTTAKSPGSCPLPTARPFSKRSTRNGGRSTREPIEESARVKTPPDPGTGNCPQYSVSSYNICLC